MKQLSTATIYNTAIYCRLSRDDGMDQDSSSIQTQKEMLTRYCKDNGFIISGTYVDDGWSGTNMNRPDFQRMLADIEDGKINCVVTKDLSRLGRNYLETGSYTEIYFPEHGVRYIAVNDNVDTLYSSTMDITPFRNLLNDMYAKDVSKKVKTALLTRQKQGKFIGTKAPYGYAKDPADKNHLVIDERYAPVVRRIYDMAKNGMGLKPISKILIEEKIPRPATVAAEMIPNYDKFIDSEESKYAWSMQTVRDILRNPVYAGHIRGQYKPTISMRSKKKIYSGPSGAFIVENCHEAIIPPKEWELVQQLVTSRRRDPHDEKDRYDNIFSGLLKCGNCGFSMAAYVDRRKKHDDIIDNTAYQCGKYRAKGKIHCSPHWIGARDLHNHILADIKRIANKALEDDEKFLADIIRNLHKGETDKSEQNGKELKKCTKRLAELDRLYAKLYEDRANGIIGERNFTNLAASYEKEQLELEEKIAAINTAIKENKATDANAEAFVQMIKEYADITELNAAMLNTLIEEIIINEPEDDNGMPVQKVDVYYKFVGMVD